jgi:hypothetical protein
MNALVLAHVPLLLASSHSGGSGAGLLLLAGPVCGTALYAAVYRYYRNADKSDAFERETRVALKTEITGQEQKVDEVRGTRDRRVDGDNSGDFRSRVATLE